MTPQGRNQQAPFELYDLQADIAEENDIAEAQPAVFRRLKAEFDRLNGQMVEARWRSKGAGAEVNWPYRLTGVLGDQP